MCIRDSSNIWPLAQPNLAKEGLGLLEITASKATLVESGIFPDIWKVQTLILVISGLNWVILNKFGSNSSFTKSLGWIINSSRSGTCFQSCLTSSKYFSIRKSVFYIGFSVFLCVYTPVPFSQTCFWTLQYRNNVSLRMANRYTRIFDAGGLNRDHVHSFCHPIEVLK